MNKVKIKPLSVNEAWKGRRFRSNKYKQYQCELTYLLPNLDVQAGKLELYVKWGFSSNGSDTDNGLKPFIDVISKKYGFNDNKIFRIIVEKEIVKKGDEFIEFKITGFNDGDKKANSFN